MSLISIFGGSFCQKDEVVKHLSEKTGYTRLGDEAIVERAVALSGMSADKIVRALTAHTSVFNKFTHEKERAVAWLKMAVAEAIAQDNVIIDGFTGMLLPKSLAHALRICLIADIRHRLDIAVASGMDEKEALKQIREHDENAAAWIDTAHGNKDPWTAGLYDILIPMNQQGVDGASALILDNLDNDAVKSNAASKQAAADFALAAKVEVHLASEGHNVAVSAENGKAILTINKNVMLLSRLEDELKAAVSGVEGVTDVEVNVGSGFYQSDIYRKADFEMPSKVLLVDDEREFVQTLSERLSMRDVGSHVVYDGESALDMVRSDDPEVMILDLKMPGIDGIEVLRRVKSERPDIEVIILTGHGSEDDRKVCMDLGAFAYLHKPVDIEVLSRTLAAAQAKVAELKKVN